MGVRTHKPTNRQTNSHKDMSVRTHKPTNGQTNRWTDRVEKLSYRFKENLEFFVLEMLFCNWSGFEMDIFGSDLKYY